MNFQEAIAEVFEQFRGIWRFRWWVAGVTWLASALGWLYVTSVPDIYRASARVYVDTNTLLKPLMQGLTAQQNTMNEVQLVSTAVLTRPNLEAVARETDLDLRTNTQTEFEGLITGLQQNIKVTGGGDNIFRIQYEDSNRDMARDVVAAVLDTFVEDAIGAQGDDAVITERALAGEMTDHEQRLQAAEASLAEFKAKNVGYMPNNSEDYYVRLQNALGAVAGAREKVRQLSERRGELQRQIEGEEPVLGIMPTAGAEVGCSQSTNLTTLRAQHAALLVEFTDKHPRLVSLQQTINSLEEQCAAEQSAATSSGVVVRSGGGSIERNPVYQSLRLQLTTAEVELVEARTQLESHEQAVAALRRDVDKIAEVETQLKQLNRDYDVVQTRHSELLRRWEDLQAKKRLDPVTDNVQFRRIEPPFALPDPVGPNRPFLLTVVLLVAVGAGAGVGFGLNQLRPVFFSRRSVQRLSGLPVLGAISMVVTRREAFRQKGAALAWVASYIVLISVTFLMMSFSDRLGAAVRTLAGGGNV